MSRAGTPPPRITHHPMGTMADLRGLVLVGVTLEVNLRALRYEPLATLLAPAPDDVPSVLRLHAGTKTILLLPATLRGLIGPFHEILAGLVLKLSSFT